MDTIYSSASNSLKSAIKIVRVSGLGCKKIPSIFSFKPTLPRELSLRKIYDSNRNLIDQALVVFFPGPSTVTGEDVFEFHIHGGIIVEKKIYNLLSQQETFRVSRRGEFTQRAFINGKIDLTQAEALNDLINAETESQFQTSISQFDGSLSKKLMNWRTEIISLLSKLEAVIDFSDEELPKDIEIEFRKKTKKLIKEQKETLKFRNYGERLRSGFVVTLVGRPNVGKSSLINYISKKNLSIVTSEAGTTRDIIETHLDFKGFPIILNDTAGLRFSKSEVEKIGIEKAIDKANASEIIYILSDNGEFSFPELNSSAHKIFVHTKCDLTSYNKEGVYEISVKCEKGIDELIEAIVEYLKSISPKTNVFLTRERHIQGVKRALNSLKNVLQIDLNRFPELASEELRVAAKEIGSITNNIDVEQVLDDIFSNFCIGK